VDLEVITASTAFIGAVVALLTAVGGGIAFLIKRADKRRESGETLMVEHFKEQLRKAESEIRWLKRLAHARLVNGTAWREQLIHHHIDPEPAEWTEVPEIPEGGQ
jgi:hypothetical protein